MQWAKACVLVLPCGRSAHLEAGYFCQPGKLLFILLSTINHEPELMYKMANGIFTELYQLTAALNEKES
jgi:hypothetical protein